MIKKCSKCGIEKELSNYYYDKHKADRKRPDCKSCFNLRMKQTRKTKAFKITFNPYQKEWQRKYRKTKKYKEWRKKEQEQRKLKNIERKKEVLKMYGECCVCCGIKDYRFLSIDHIKNDGFKDKQHRKNRPNTYLMYKKIIDGEYAGGDLQIMCFNCNIAKQHNGGECPHKQDAIVCDNNKRTSK